MSGIELLTAKVTTPVRRVIQDASGKFWQLRNTSTDYFVNLEKQEKSSLKGLFKDMWGEDRYWVFKRKIDKYKQVKDPKIKKHINKRLHGYGITDNLQYCEDLMDAYNVLKGHYTMLGDVDNYYKEFEKIHSKYAKFFAYLSMQNESYIRGLIDIKKDDKKFLDEVIEFKHDSRTEALKKYVAGYSQEEPEMTNYMYTKYYLPRLSKNVRTQCEKISNEFGTKVFVFDEKDQQNLDFIYDELMDWKTKGKGEAKFPSIIDISKIKVKFNDITGPADGTFNSNNNEIDLKDLIAIRHEMIHLNNKGPNHLEIIMRGMNYESIKMDRPYKEEIIKAGINADLAYKGLNELIAYAGEKDCSQYSAEFKSLLEDLGLPKWVFDLKPLRQITEE